MWFRLSKFFTYKIAWLLVPILFATGLAMVSLTFFLLACAFFLLSGIWSLITWLTSEAVRTNARTVAVLKTTSWQSNADGYLAKYFSHLLLKYGVSGLIVLLTGWSIVWTYTEKEKYELKLTVNLLRPANEPIPNNACSSLVNETSSIVFLGPMPAVIRKFPKTIIRKLDQDILVVDKNDDGSLAVSLDIRNKNGDLIVQIIRGEFTTNPNNLFKMERYNDRSRLMIKDTKGNIALDLHFFNPHAMWLNFMTDKIAIQGERINSSGGMCLVGDEGPNEEPAVDIRSDFGFVIGP